MISQTDLHNLKGQADISHIIGSYVELTKSGPHYKGICPFHSEKTPSFLVTPGKQIFHCFGCGETGDVIAFVQRLDNLDFPAAVKKVADLAGISIDMDGEPTPAVQPVKSKSVPGWQPHPGSRSKDLLDLAAWQAHAEKFISYCHSVLLADQETMDYLQGRGVPKEAVLKYKLGLNPKTAYRPRTSWGLTGGINPETKRPFMLYLPKGIVIPFYVKGELCRIRIRLAEQEIRDPKKKYHVVIGSGSDTFVSRHDAEVYVVVETDLDAVMIDHIAGDLVGAMSLGSVSPRPTTKATASLKKAEKILNSLDYDKAGRQQSPWWSKNFTNSIRFPVPEGGDPGEAFQIGINIRTWIWAGMPARFKINAAGEYQDTPPSMPQPVKKNEEVKILELAPEQKAAPSRLSLLPESVVLLNDLLHKCPVAIKETQEEGIEIIELVTYSKDKHWDLKKEVSGLVFGSMDVQIFIGAHPDRAISAANFLKEKKHAE